MAPLFAWRYEISMLVQSHRHWARGCGAACSKTSQSQHSEHLMVSLCSLKSSTAYVVRRHKSCFGDGDQRICPRVPNSKRGNQ